MTPLDFESEIILENEIALLRPLALTDLPELNHFAINEPNLWKYSLVSANSEANMKMYVELALKAKNNSSSYPFLIIDKRTNEVAGSSRFYDYDEHHKTVQLGYTWYGERFQRTGLNRNCKLLLLTHAFETLGLERVEFRADNNNQRSIDAMKSLGCKVEGVLRNNCASLVGRRDSIVLSILKSEWNQTIKRNLKTKLAAR
jgi:RimJ/RimL family protein N-acetyltransferase